MLSLLEFLAAAPKSYVIKLHRRENPAEGLVPAAKVIQLVQDWVLRRERVEKALQDIDAEGRYLLGLVYVSQDRGAAESELLSAQERLSPSQAALLLSRLEQEMLLYTRQGDEVRTYHGFEELAAPLLAAILPENWLPVPEEESVSWISYRHFLTAHLGHFLGQIELGAIKITQNGEMHRKDAQELAARFAFGERLSGSIPGEEVQFLLRFAVQSGLLAQEEGVLRLTPEGKAFARLPRAEAERRLRDWWAGTRLRGLGHTLGALAGLSRTPAGAAGTRAAPLANLLWIHSGTQRKGYQDPKSLFTWENLPRALQELWLLGLVDFGMIKGRIGRVRPVRGLADILAAAPATGEAGAAGTPGAEAASAGATAGATAGAAVGAAGGAAAAAAGDRSSASRPVSLPNLESLVPLDAPFERQRPLELAGIKSNDEYMARYRFTKESVIRGLQAGLPMDEFRELLQWLGFEGPAQRTLVDWASTYASTLFMDALLLRVSDPERMRELQEIPQFMELITETVPGYGFVLSRQNKARVRELLQHFGLVPGEDSRRVADHEPVVLDPGAGSWALPVPEPGQPTWRENPVPSRLAQPPAGEKTPAPREQDIAQRLEAIEAAIQNDRKVEFSYPAAAPKRITLKPLLLLRHRTPVKLIGIEVDSGHRNEYLLDQVKALRVVE